jgi:hypothetical protein
MAKNPLTDFRYIPDFKSVKQVIQHRSSKETGRIPLAVTMIMPDIASGKPRRYTVLRIILLTGKTIVLGRELYLKLAREIAREFDYPLGRYTTHPFFSKLMPG